MNKKPISQLPDADALTGQEYIPIVQNGITKKTRSGNYLGERGPEGPQGPQGLQGVSPVITAATPIVLSSGQISLSYDSGLAVSNGALTIDSQSGYLESELEKKNLEPLRTWNRNFNSVRYSLDSGTLNQSTDVVVLGDSISEGWFGSQTNGTSWVQRFSSNISSITNPGGRTGSWIPAGTGASDSTWYVTPRFTQYPTSTVSVDIPAGTQLVGSVDDLEALGLKVNSKVKIAGQTRTIISIISTAFAVDSPFPQFIPSGTPIYIPGTEVISRGFSLRSMNMPALSKQSLTFTGTSVSVFFRKVNSYGAGGIRFSILDSSLNPVFIKNSTLASAITDPNATTITLNTSATSLGLYPGCTLQIGSEQMTITGISNSTTASINVSRGVNGTTRGTYSSGSVVYSNYLQYLTFSNSVGTYAEKSGGQHLVEVDLELPERNEYTLLVEHKIVSSAILESPSGLFSSGIMFDGVYVHDGTEKHGIRIWNSSRFGSAFNTWNSLEFNNISLLSSSMDSSTELVQLSSSATELDIRAGDILSIYTDGSFFGYENMLVRSVSGSICTVTRGYNGTAIGTHANNLSVAISYARTSHPTLNDGWLSIVRQGFISPSLYIVALGSNDQSASVTPEAMTQRMATLTNNIRASHIAGSIGNPSIVFMLPPLRTSTVVSQGLWDSCLAAMYAVASELGVHVWDWARFTGSVGVTSVNSATPLYAATPLSIDSSTTSITLVNSATPSINIGTVISMKSAPYGYLEKMLVTAISGKNLTVKRGFEGSAAAVHNESYFDVYVGDELFWTIDGIHPTAEGQLSIGDFATSKALYSSSISPQTKGRVIHKTKGNITLGSIGNTDYVYIVTGQHVVTLPTAISNTSRYIIKNKHSSNITIQSTSAQTIDGTTTISLAPNESVDLISDNSNWSII